MELKANAPTMRYIRELESQLKDALNGTTLKRYNEEKEAALAQLKKAESVIRFYGNKYAWNGTNIGPSDYWFDNNAGHFIGGAKAREYFESKDEK